MADDTNTPQERPEGVSETEWDALGDPGKAAIQRERQARHAAEQALAAATKPKPKPPEPAGGDGKPPAAPDPTDIAALVQAAVERAVQPFQEREQQREVEQAAGRVRDAVAQAAQGRFHDPSDAIANVALTDVLDGNGVADPAKVTAALDDLAARKPHLVKVHDGRRRAPDGTPIGGAPAPGASIEDRVKAQLALMQRGT